jgi:DNA-directed RNA polymerase specialized sigma24 family protein
MRAGRGLSYRSPTESGSLAMGIDMEELPDQMSLSVLENRCAIEINKYRRREPSNDQYCLEIFHRAMIERDELAWDLMHRCFGTFVRSWLRNHPKRDIALRFESEENYVAETFKRFWQATERNQELEFRTLAAALQYLKASLNGAIMDTLRAYSRQKEIPLPEPGSPYQEEPAAAEPDDGLELWESIQSLLPAGRELRVAFLLFHDGLKPREIVRYCQEEFSEVKEVYRLRRNIIERLVRNLDQIRWRLSDEEK